MDKQPNLHRVYQAEYTVYNRDGLYCFLKGTLEQTEISLTDSFSLGGQYIFCPEELEKEETEAFASDGVAFLGRWNRKLLFVWVENPKAPYYDWRFNKLEAMVKSQYLFFDSYRLKLDTWDSLNVQNETFVFTFTSEQCYSFGKGQGNLKGTGSSLLIGTIKEECGTLIGTFVWEDEDVKDFTDALDVGMYFSRFMEQEEKDSIKNGFVFHGRSRVLIPQSKPKLDLHLTPQVLNDHNRTYFGLSGNQFSSLFSTDAGMAIPVMAKDSARLVFEQRPVLAYQNREGNMAVRKKLYLGIEGSFAVTQKNHKMLCGISGTETLLIQDDGEYGYLEFSAGKPAVFPYEETDVEYGTAAWVGVSKGIYYSQPDTSALYARLTDWGLRYLEVPAAVFDKSMPPVPMLPYREISYNVECDADSGEDGISLEEGIYQRRRSLIMGTDESDGSGVVKEGLFTNSVRAVTPHGLIVDVETDGSYNWIGFANVERGMVNPPDMRFETVDKELRHRFQEKELLCVISDPLKFAEAEPTGFDIAIEDGVRFLFMPKNWRTQSDSPTMVIFKYAGAKNIEEALSDNTVFQSMLDNAYTGEDDKKVKEGYEDFINAVTDIQFRGILALNVPVTLEGMPPEVQFLLTGVPMERFYASFLIIKAGKPDTCNNEIVLEKSGITGLIDYVSEDKLFYTQTPPDYDYLTREIHIQIKDSRIASFYSASEVLVNRLFEAPAAAQDNPDGNCMILQGHRVEKDGAYVYQYSLQQSVCYELSGSGIDKVWIREMSLTVGEHLEGTFSMAGTLVCQEIAGVDLLGYGDEESQNGLPFEQLVLKMKEAESADQAKVMSMEYGLLYFDSGKAAIREGSFPSVFAASFDSLLIETGGENPEKKGYAPISAPISQGIPASSYQGFVWNIPVGSLGDMSGQSGLILQMLTAFWMGEEGKTEYYVGIKLPGALSGDNIRLQGIFKLGFGSLSLEKKEDEDSKITYLIRLHNFHLEVLGASFPKGGSDIYLFSNGKDVGWYAAYQS